MALRALICCAILAAACHSSRAADAFPDRKVAQQDGFSIEYSAGDEAYAAALAKQLPVDLNTAPPGDSPSFSVEELRARRAQVLKLIAELLAVPESTPVLGRTFDSFTTSFALLQSLKLAPTATRFALWRKPELAARLGAGQSVTGFHRNSDGDIEFSVVASFQFNDGEPPEKAMERMRAEWGGMTWPVKIGEDPALAPEAEIRERLGAIREHAVQLGMLQAEEIQRLAVMTVLHESVESTLIDQTLRSADRRWFCEGVANYVSFRVLATLLGAEAARSYYDVDAEVARFAALRSRADLERWPVLEDPKSQAVPTDVNTASYAFATRAVFDAFSNADPGLLAAVLNDVRKTPAEKTNIETVYAAYRARTGKDLRGFLAK